MASMVKREGEAIFMCIFGVALNVNENYPFVFAGNRDEVKKRPTANAHFWPPEKNILAGKDLEKGGTWLGISRQGKFAVLSNVRQFPIQNKPKSRGELVKNCLEKQETDWLKMTDLSQYDGFNLLYGTIDKLTLISNKTKEKMDISKGVIAVSNGILETSWPKTNDLKKEMEKILTLKNKEEMEERLFAVLQNDKQYPDELLPNTGVGIDLERKLSSIYIAGEDYGTRSSTVIIVDNKRNCRFVEKTYGENKQKRVFSFKLE